MPESVVNERRSAIHSEKPESFRKTIERLYPLGRRLELFGRREVEGWTVYGNELQPIARITCGLGTFCLSGCFSTPLYVV